MESFQKMEKTEVKNEATIEVNEVQRRDDDDDDDDDDDNNNKVACTSTKKGEITMVDKEVKSAAIVKYSEVEVPASFTRLRCNTDLNLPPSNWLSNSVETYGLRPSTLFHRSGFSSFRMAHMFPDCVGEVDVVSDAENVKKLLKIPYSHGPVSMMIHRVENTLLIDEFDVHKYLLREAECQWEWFKKFFVENIMESANSKDKLICHRDNSRNALQQKSLVSKFLYHSLVVAESQKSTLSKADNQEKSPEESGPLPLTYKNNPPLPDPSLEEESPDPGSNHKFARNVVWTFEDIQMLLGTDMPIFGGGTHPCISLRLRDMAKPINVLTGMDYWLDNLMCNVPEVIMCYHLNGIVQKYELIKTEDLPHLENSKFSPKVIRDIAQNILSFLKANATKAGHTYWLFKGKDDDVVKLYDLTSLCTDVMDEKGQTPFTVPVAMLLYRVARNMKNSSDGRRQAATIRMLLNNSLSLLSPEKYPEIVTSTHYMLSDLYIPADINPASPELSSEDDSQVQANGDMHRMPRSQKEASIKSLSLANMSEINMEETEFISPAPPIGLDIRLRCTDGLVHVLRGLKSLKYLEDQKENAPPQDITEPKMAKPFQTIPMPYQSLDDDKQQDIKMPKKRPKRKRKEARQPDDSPKTLLCKLKTDAVPSWRPPPPKTTTSWKIHLKTLLYEKFSLIYATLMEKAYANGNFGEALRHTKMVLMARAVLSTLREDVGTNDVESYLLGRAGDALFMVVQNSLEMDAFDKEYATMSDLDLEAMEEVRTEPVDVDTFQGEPFPACLRNLEVLLLKSTVCYQRALALGSSPDNQNLFKRLGNIENELGVFYMNQAAARYQEEFRSTGKDVKVSAYKKLFAKSQDHLQNGIKAFTRIKDEANLALLYSNTGRLMRVQAHFLSVSETDEDELATHENNFYKKSILNYQKALQVLGDRKYNPTIWDSVHWELSTALYAMATLLQDYPTSRNKEDAEKEVTETLYKALKYCDVDTPGSRQPMYQYRTAMIHHRLASLYHKCYRSLTDDETKRKKLHQLCRLHYEKSTKYLLQLENSTEYLRVQLERVALAEFQAESATSLLAKIKHYDNALVLLLEVAPVLKIVSGRDIKFYDSEDEKASKEELEAGASADKPVLEGGKGTESENECMLLDILEQRLQFVLLSLTKLAMSRSDLKKGLLMAGDFYKKLYGLTLRSESDKTSPITLSRSLLQIVTSISEAMDLPR